jgi:hypothetical protein
MPQLPSWIRGANPAPYAAQGIGLGIQAAGQRDQARFRQAQLYAEAAQRNQQLQLAQQQQAVREEIAQQEMALRKQQVALAAQEIGMRGQLQSSQIEEVARRRAAMMEYQRRVAGGEDAMKVIMELGPAMGSQQTVEAAVIRGQLAAEKAAAGQGDVGAVGQPIVTPDGKVIPGYFAMRSASGKGFVPHLLPAEKPILTEKDRLAHMRGAQNIVTKLREDNPVLARKPAEKRTEEEKQTAETIKFWEDEIERVRKMKLGEGAAATALPTEGEGAGTGAVLRYDRNVQDFLPTGATSSTTGGGISIGGIPLGRARSSTATIPPGAAPEWPPQEGVAPPISVPVPATTNAPGAAVAPPSQPSDVTSTLVRATDWLRQKREQGEGIGMALAANALRSPFGQAFADIEEGIAGLLDLPAEELTGLRDRVRSLREDIESYGLPETATIGSDETASLPGDEDETGWD